jgi:preprotein translocase subunit SecF
MNKEQENIQSNEIEAEEVVQEELSADAEQKTETPKEKTKETPKDKTKDASQKESKEKVQDEPKEEESEEEIEFHTLKEVLNEQAREDEEPMSNNFTLRKILGGDILSAEMMRGQIWLIIIIVLFVIVYISNRYSVQKNLLEIDNLNKELQDVKYKALSSSSQLTERSRESHVLELLKQNNDSTLKMPEQPPFIIEVKE